MKELLGKIYVSADASIIKENKFLVMMDAGCEAKTRQDLEKISSFTNRPLKYVFLTHNHWDHVHNVKFFRKKFTFNAITNRKIKGKKQFVKETTMKLGRTKYVIIPTPGHSPSGIDICIYMSKERVLFTGDTCQPQGPSYHKTDFSTPVPYYHDGDAYIKSLKKLLKLRIDYVITGHGQVFDKNSLEITLHTTERIKALAREMVKKHRKEKNNIICNLIFQHISRERGFRNLDRIRDPYYRECDIHSMMYWVKKFK